MDVNHIRIEVNCVDGQDDPTSSSTENEKPKPLVLLEDQEFDYLRPREPLQRSSSLKAITTPPGTPHRKKAVRFADALGLDLESVRHVLNLSDPPFVPKSAVRDLNLNNDQEEDRNVLTSKVKVEQPSLRAWFSNPAASVNFDLRVQDRKILLGHCDLDNIGMTVGGRIHVANFAFEKRVTVRYTTNAWVTFTDLEATYESGSADRRTDYFRFTIDLRNYFAVGSRMEFSVRLICDGQTYWDANNGSNYRIECCPVVDQ